MTADDRRDHRRRRCAYGIAGSVVAAALRENSTITVYDTDATINRWRLDRRGQRVVVHRHMSGNYGELH